MSYADECLERAKNFPFDSSHYGHDTIACAQACEAELDVVYGTMVPELVRRLKDAIAFCQVGPINQGSDFKLKVCSPEGRIFEINRLDWIIKYPNSGWLDHVCSPQVFEAKYEAVK